MVLKRIVSGGIALAACVLVWDGTHAQTATTQAAATSPKTIGQPSQAQSAVVPSLIVFNAHGAVLQGQKLTLTGVAPNAIVFADRPVRAAGHDLTAHIIEDWSSGSDNFAKDPPNATVSVFAKNGVDVKDAVVVLKAPKLTDNQLVFDVDVLEGDLKGADGAASVFIDIIGMPWTPLSYAGVARRTAYRAAWYRAAHPYYYRPPYAYRPPCGYYPYPRCW